MKRLTLFIRFWTPWVLVLGISLSSGCTGRKNPVYTYQTPQVQSPVTGGMQASRVSSQSLTTQVGTADHALEEQISQDAASFSVLSWSPPAHWEPQPLGMMRKGNWKVCESSGSGSAQVTVLVFPGDVGGILANINRWAQQMGMAPVEVESLPEILENIEVSHRAAHWLKLADAEHDQAVMAAIVPTERGTWFFKITGDRNCVLNEQQTFRLFLATVELAP